MVSSPFPEGLIDGFERRRLPGDGITVDALVGGSGAPLLLLHGYPQTRVMWRAIAPALTELAEKHRVIGEVRGEGVFWALDLVADPESREPLPAAEMGRIKGALVERGLLPFIADNRIHVVPPCVVTHDEVAQAAEIYDEVLGTVAV